MDLTLKQRIITFGEVDSTNSYCLKNIASLEDGAIVIADKQSLGRGRLSRKWQSSVEGNLYASIVLKPQTGFNSPLANITQYMACICAKTLSLYGVSVCLKWPNDVLTKRGKIAGILSETSVKAGVLEGLVLGIGVNIAMSACDLDKIDQAATSLNVEMGVCGKIVGRNEFASLLFRLFFESYEKFLEEGFPMIADEYSRLSKFIGSEVEVSETMGKVRGKALGFTEDGALKIEVDGKQRIIMAGDVTC